MTPKLKCIHCHSPIKPVYQTIKSISKEAGIVLDNAPMYYCPKCNDNLISLEAIEAFNYIRKLPLNSGEINTFDYNAIKEHLKSWSDLA